MGKLHGRVRHPLGVSGLGQRVRVVHRLPRTQHSWKPKMDKTVGKTGTVVCVSLATGHPCVVFDDDGLNPHFQRGWFYCPEALEVVDDADACE